jgi:hypothetical protein
MWGNGLAELKGPRSSVAATRGGELGFGLGLKKLQGLEVLFKVLPVLSHAEHGLYLVAAFDSITMRPCEVGLDSKFVSFWEKFFTLSFWLVTGGRRNK